VPAAPKVGSLHVICGSMFAGKSEELIRLIRRAKIARLRVAVFKPNIDSRYGREEVVSHNGVGMEAVSIDPQMPQGILACLERDEASGDGPAQVVAVDEAQFFHSALIDVVQELLGSGRRVLVAGLDTDFAGRPFGPMPWLLALADEVTKLNAICVKCGRPAFHTQRLIDGRPAGRKSPLILIGGSESYEARCRHCWELPDD